MLCKKEVAGITVTDANQGSVTITSEAGGTIAVRQVRLMKAK